MDNNITDRLVNEGKFDQCECKFDHLLDVLFKKYVCYKINCGYFISLCLLFRRPRTQLIKFSVVMKMAKFHL